MRSTANALQWRIGKPLADDADGVPQPAPVLLPWIDNTCEWELNRRRGFDYPLQPPEAAIDRSGDAVSIDAAMAIVS